MQDSKLLRGIDRYLGSALCAILSAARRILGGWRTKQEKRRERILLVELFEMGASIMLVPSIRFIKREKPDAEIHVLTTSSCHPVWAAIGLLEPENIHVVQNASATGFVIALVRRLLELRRLKFDLVIDYELFMRISALAVGCLKAGERGGFHRYDLEGLYRGGFYICRVSFNQNSHIARNYLALTKSAFFACQEVPNFKEAIPLDEILFPPTYPGATDDELRALVPWWEPGKRFMVICADVGKHLPMRNYPRQSFARIIDLMSVEFPDLVPVLIGTGSEGETAAAIRSGTKHPERVINLCGQTTLDQLLKLITRAEIVLTNDNGPAHFATLTGTRVIALFSTDSPYVYGPLGEAILSYAFFQCSPCISAFNHKTSSCKSNLCLQAITPESVAGLICIALGGSANFRTINNQTPYLV